MSFLYPLLLTGIAAVALPIVLHMIRRHTRKRVTFSSLMFLRTTAPRLRNRGRLEHVPLLILRCLILCLLAFAFARPFLPRSIASRKSQPGKRIALLIDTSASMRRTGMWDRAMEETRSALGDMGPTDRVCVMTFDQGTRTLMSFEQWSTIDPLQRPLITIRSLASVSPGWGPTNLGQALITAAEAIEDDEINDARQTQIVRQVVLVSDLQQGGDLAALSAYEWPERTELSIKAIPCRETTNASLQLITARDPLAPSRPGDLPSVRITNSADAARNRFQLRWADEADTGTSAGAMEVYIPAGRSIVVQVPSGYRPSTAARLILSGDDHDFDNTLHVAPVTEPPVRILYVGNDDPNDAQAMLYYIRQAFRAGDGLSSQVTQRAGSDPLSEADITAANLVIVTDALTQANTASLRRHMETGRTVLFVMRSTEAAVTLSGLSGIDNLECREAEAGRYAMLDSIDFKHPLFAPFSDPRFGDFTRIHFWKYRRIRVAGVPPAEETAEIAATRSGMRVPARFDSNDPAWLEVAIGKGSLLVWTGGWHPSDSDLALSSKFVPLLYSILEHGGTLSNRQSQYFVGDPVPVPSGEGKMPATRRVRRPNDSTMDPDDSPQAFTQMDLPGIYEIESPAGIRAFAVNLSPGESRTEPMAVEDIERMGISLEPVSDAAAQTTSQATRQAGFTEMESEQKLWRWVLMTTLAMLLIEIWLSGRLIRPRVGSEGEQP